MIITKRGEFPEKVDKTLRGVCSDCASEAEAKESELKQIATANVFGYLARCPVCKQGNINFWTLLKAGD